MEFRILGPLEVVDEGRRIAIPARLSRALLACLLLHANEPISADRLVDDLWGGQPPRTAAASLQNHVSRLRKALGQERIGHEPAGYLLRVDADHFDLARFDRLVDEAGTAPAAERAQLLRAALALWRGPPLEDLAFEEFAQPAIAHLNEQRLAVLEACVDADLALGRGAELVEELRALIRAHPLRERLRGQQMLALYRAGRQADALAAYGEARRVLRDDLGLEPCEELRKLERRILEQDPTLENHPTNLPAQPTPLIGRERELRVLRKLLLQEDVRLLTLTGTGGTGKTRLGLEVAASLIADYPSGVFLISLAAITESELLVPAIAQALSVRARRAEPLIETLRVYLGDKQMLLLLDNFEQISAAAASVASLLGSAPALTVLVTSRMPLHVTGERTYLVPPLALPDPDSLLDLSSLTRCEAVALFVDRAQAQKPDFMLTQRNAHQVAEICVGLDGLPLALELAAARIRVLPPQTLLRRLDHRLKLLTGGAQDRSERQRTLRATIEWSFDLLSDGEKTLFRRLAIFVGGCRLDAAEAVCEPGGELGIDALDGLSLLVEKSLLQEKEDSDGEPRFVMLETIREFAVEQLEASGEMDEFRLRHAEYVCRLCEKAEGSLTGEERGEEEYGWIDRLQGEHENLRAALDWALEAGKHELAMRIAAAAAWFWSVGNHAEGRSWLSRALEPTTQQVTVARARALYGAALLASRQGDEREARRINAEALGVCEQVGDMRTKARCLTLLTYSACELTDDLEVAQELAADAHAAASKTGSPALIGDAVGVMAIVIAEEGDYPAARALSEEELEWKRKARAPSWIGAALLHVGWHAIFEGELGRARQALEEALTLTRHQGAIANCHSNLGVVDLSEGQPDQAAGAFRHALRLCRELGDRRTSAEALRGIAACAAASHAFDRAAFLTGVADGLREGTGFRLGESERLMEDRYLSSARTALGEQAWNSAWAQGRTTPLEEAIEYALSSEPSLIEGGDKYQPV